MADIGFNVTVHRSEFAQGQKACLAANLRIWPSLEAFNGAQDDHARVTNCSHGEETWRQTGLEQILLVVVDFGNPKSKGFGFGIALKRMV